MNVQCQGWTSAVLWAGLAARLWAASADVFEGTWGGTLAIGDLRLPLTYHINTSPRGTMTALMDSPDQGAFNIPALASIAGQNEIRLEVRSIAAVFRGKLEPGQAEIAGAWEQGGQSFPMSLRRNVIHPGAEHRSPADLAAGIAAGEKACGVWDGVVPEGSRETAVRITVWRAVSLAASGTIDLPGQSAYNLPLRPILLSEGKLRFSAPGVGATFEGEISADGSALRGEWIRSGRHVALELKKAPPPDYARKN